MKPILVWGATGYIGSHLVRDLVSRQLPILALTRQPASVEPAFQDPLVRWISVPTDDPELSVLTEAIQQVDLIYNLAGTSGAVASNLDPMASLHGNSYIQARFLEACGKAANRPHVVFASSRLVYGPPDSLPVTERFPVKPTSYYGAHKLCVENYHQIAALRSEISYTICRISNPYGAHRSWLARSSGFINYLIQRGCNRLPLNVFEDGRQLRDYIHISDLTQVLYLCGRSEARNEIFNIGGGRSISIRQAATVISQFTGAPINYVPWELEAALVESGDYIADISKARTLLGFEPNRLFETSVEELVRTQTTSLRIAVASRHA